MNINSYITRFLRVVEAAWDPLVEGIKPAEASDIKDEWMQFHWELLVELRLQEENHNLCLLTYGNGAETADGRIFPSRQAPLHAVYCRPKAGEKLYDVMTEQMIEVPALGFLVEDFGHAEPGYYIYQPPFNVILVHRSYEEEPLLIRITDVDFHLAPFQAVSSGQASESANASVSE